VLVGRTSGGRIGAGLADCHTRRPPLGVRARCGGFGIGLRGGASQIWATWARWGGISSQPPPDSSRAGRAFSCPAHLLGDHVEPSWLVERPASPQVAHRRSRFLAGLRNVDVRVSLDPRRSPGIEPIRAFRFCARFLTRRGHHRLVRPLDRSGDADPPRRMQAGRRRGLDYQRRLDDLEGIRYIRIETTDSPSWVSWREIEVIAGD